ncbi:unnamed protein product [Durusdinium trenchii]|uniref:PA domain-containing protein n=2 Tax=Durusdinium trenchii TaxID=1381693 RepID=A0ABP0MZP8_9DINO
MGAMATAAVALLVSFTSVEGHSTLWVHGETATQSFVAIPAVWNAYLPSFGQPKLSVKAPLDRESVNLQPSFSGRMVQPFGENETTRSLACDILPSTPQIESLALLVDRGLCDFRQKAQNAYNAGYKALIVMNTVPGQSKVPDMTSPNGALDDRLVELPAWAVEKATGQTLKSWMSTDQLRLEVTDDPRRPSLGAFQEDSHGLRLVFTK